MEAFLVQTMPRNFGTKLPSSSSSSSLFMKFTRADVAVVGSGPAGQIISYMLQAQQGVSVALIDPRVNDDAIWYPNYGEWRDEWHCLAEKLHIPELKECTTTEWEVTDCFFGGKGSDDPKDYRTRLNRPYVRVDRVKLQSVLKKKFDAAGGISIDSKLSSKRIASNLFDKNLVHDAEGSTLTLDSGEIVRAKVVIDATGFESRLIGKENCYFARGTNKMSEPGFQIAYGFLAHVDNNGPYDMKAMTLFDYRTEPFDDDESLLKSTIDRPTFMYAMPLGTLPDGNYRIFFEETSLVGKDERRLSFEECISRAKRRLKQHNINIIGIEETEYCYIPMGGELPDSTQRVIGFGGAANMVHPSTGYQVQRMMASAPAIASVIGSMIKEDSHASPDAIAAAAYATLWNPQNRGQRDFQLFGGDFLMRQSVDQLRGFFSAFFSIEQEVWAGFLAGWPGLPGNFHHETWNSRFKFCLDLFLKMPNPVRVAIIAYAIQYTFQFGPNNLVRSITPLFGEGPDVPQWNPPMSAIGDDDAKDEARKLIAAFKPTAEPPSDSDVTMPMAGSKTECVPSPFNM